MQPSVAARDICTAIQQQRLIRFEYAGLERVVEPYVCGYDRHGSELFTGWQVAGHTRSDASLRWRTYRIDRIGRMELLGQIAPPKRHGYSEQDARYDIVLASR
jgi:predicted DNA-binding transcriptional regulator YafY